MKLRSGACNRKGEFRKVVKMVTNSALGFLGAKGEKTLWSIMKFNIYKRFKKKTEKEKSTTCSREVQLLLGTIG